MGSGVKIRPLGYERVYLPLCKVADTPFHIQGANSYLKVIQNEKKYDCLGIKRAKQHAKI